LSFPLAGFLPVLQGNVHPKTAVMETFILEKDIAVLYVTADSFPQGIEAAFDRIKQLVPAEGRILFGLSAPEGGPIVYKAAVEEKAKGEAEKYGCQETVIKKGKYIVSELKNWKEHVTEIGKIFDRLINSRPDLVAPCVEWYHGKDVRCMVRIAE